MRIQDEISRKQLYEQLLAGSDTAGLKSNTDFPLLANQRDTMKLVDTCSAGVVPNLPE
jgi:hypothetical protein